MDHTILHDVPEIDDQLKSCWCGDIEYCAICRFRQQVINDKQARQNVLDLLDELAQQIVDYPQIWVWGDGYGGWFTEELRDALERHGMESPVHLKQPRPVVQRLAERDGWDCFYCRTTLEGKPDRPIPTIDHLVPRSRGGTNHAENLVLCCQSCNSSKGARTPEEWQQAKDAR